MKRMRPFLFTVALGAGSLALLAGCSGKPENSPVIRKKFAEMEVMKETVDQMTTDVKILNDEIARLREENSELRAFLPNVDGTSAIEKISRLENRLREMEQGAGASSGSQAPRASERPSPSQRADTASEVALEERSIAGANREVVAAQQQSSAPRPAQSRQESPSQSFRDMTNRSSTQSSSPAQSTVRTPSSSTPAPAASSSAAPSRARGSYHTIAAGETLESVARQHNVTPERLRAAIGLPQGAVLRPGQRIFIPAN